MKSCLTFLIKIQTKPSTYLTGGKGREISLLEKHKCCQRSVVEKVTILETLRLGDRLMCVCVCVCARQCVCVHACGGGSPRARTDVESEFPQCARTLQRFPNVSASCVSLFQRKTGAMQPIKTDTLVIIIIICRRVSEASDIQLR